MTITPIYKAAALGFFRSSAFFVCAVVAFSRREDKTGTILLMLVFLVDVASYHMLQALTITTESVYSRVWGDTLTNRLFYEKLFDKIRDREQVDVPLLFKEATKDAAADVETFLKDSTLWAEWGWFKKKLAGVWSFVWLWISYGLFYGAAGIIGGSIR